MLWNLYFLAVGALYSFNAVAVLSEPFAIKLLAGFFLLLSWTALSCALPHFFLSYYANQVWREAEELFWEDYYQKRRDKRRLETRLSPRMRAANLQKARDYEKALRFEDAAGLYETLGLWEEAGRARRRELELRFPWWNFRLPGPRIDRSIHIENSVINRSTIGGKEY